MKRRAITLLEVMIVIFIIGIVAGVLGYNMKGSIDKGRAFKTKQAKNQLKDLLLLKGAEDNIALELLAKNPEFYLKDSPLVRKASAILKDGWGNSFTVTVDGNKLKITSEAYSEYKKKNKKN